MEKDYEQKVLFERENYRLTQYKYGKRIYRLETDDFGSPYWVHVETVSGAVSKIFNLMLGFTVEELC
jgi:hypothetical protein